jgi:putative lipoic acid-binding regulatory protein
MAERNFPPLYPCLFPMKIIGESSADFESEVLSVLRMHVGEITEGSIGRKRSSGGKYLSLTVQITAQSREHVERLYAELNARECVIMVI